MSEHVIDDAIARLTARLEELRPLLDEASRVEAALVALCGDRPRPPVTALDVLVPAAGE
jgi:hypothetical protein